MNVAGFKLTGRMYMLYSHEEPLLVFVVCDFIGAGDMSVESAKEKWELMLRGGSHFDNLTGSTTLFVRSTTP